MRSRQKPLNRRQAKIVSVLIRRNRDTKVADLPIIFLLRSKRKQSSESFFIAKTRDRFISGFFLNTLKWVLCEFYILYLYKTNQALFIQPWLTIPEDQYRYYQLFFYIPFGILIWIFNAGVVQTLATTFGRKGTYSDTLNIIGIMIFTAFVFIDTIDYLFMFLNGGNWNVVFNSMTRVLFSLWGSIFLAIGLIENHKLKPVISIIITVLLEGKKCPLAFD